VLYDSSGKTADEVCKVVGLRGEASLPTSPNYERRHQHPSTADQTVFEGYAKNCESGRPRYRHRFPFQAKNFKALLVVIYTGSSRGVGLCS